jgi:hypothetical protein
MYLMYGKLHPRSYGNRRVNDMPVDVWCTYLADTEKLLISQTNLA